MRDQRALLRQVLEGLSRWGIPYMICGSVASSVLGEPRMTANIDIVNDPTEEPLLDLVGELEAAGLYADADSARAALQARAMFNVIDPVSGFKVDFIIRKDRPFSIEEFRRRREAEVWGIRALLTTAEDLILSKLERSMKGASERQFRDALGVFVLSMQRLDREYLRIWAGELGLEALLKRLWAEADP
ncbi:MAG: hypothetical protein RL885_32165 [Planctomycetota bacterium]